MRKSLMASISPSKGGNGNQLGVRTRKKHKRLDAINEDEFIRNRRVKLELNEGGGSSSRELCIDKNDSELRRSSRTRRVPVILDSSPPPARKRRKLEKLGKIVHRDSVKKLKGKGNNVKFQSPPSSLGKVRVQGPPLSSSSKEELRAQRVGLRSSGTSGSPSLVYRRNQPRGKRKLIWDDEEDVKAGKDEAEDEIMCSDSGKSKVIKPTELDRGRVSIDGDDELHDERVKDGSLDNEVDGLGGEGDGNFSLSISGRAVGNEELVVVSNPNHFVEKGSEGLVDLRPEENSSRIYTVVENEQKHEPLDSLEVIKDAEKEKQVADVTAVSTGLAEDVERDFVNEGVAEVSEKHAEVEIGANLGNCTVISGGTPRSRVKKGRRCGLCGGGIDGKPPKIMANDSAGSDNDGYSGSSASEECSYDPWDGFGDEPGWLGRLLGPVNDRYGIAGIWVHQHCAVWSPEVYFAGLGCLKNIKAALCRGRVLKCTRCGRPGATLGCRVDRCPRTYHLPCARASGCIFDHRKFLIACADHRYLFEPHGHQYAQRIKKLKVRKMKMEIRKQSNDASRKDIEAEEKWLEKCGEDEEFLRRETKRLQRDLLRIAPVYIGGPNSGDENPFEGWESVAGLKDVIQCMKEVVLLPLLYPEFFDNMGITPPRGVLLHGYPGTGKTLIVKALIGACARGDRRIAYFARKGADCLGKYVGDAERQLRLLFQVAEKSQPSIIFFDEIDGLAPVRTRQQDQTHSSVVSTLLALLDGLKSRGSVIVIGATNRPDAVDPALRRPGRFDREIYFPLPSMKDRAAILALHTKKWPKPVSGALLEQVAARTVGFAGADLQALCAQSAVIAMKRNCSWHQIISFAENNTEGRCPQLPSFVVEERDWLEALSHAPPPCSRREAGMAANEVVGFPLHIHLVPFLLKPLLCLIVSLYLDDRLWLPTRLVNAGAAIKKVVLFHMEKKGLPSDNWWCHAQDMVQHADITKEIARNLSIAGILDGGASSPGSDLANDTVFGDDGYCHNPNCNSGSLKTSCYTPPLKTGYRMLISGDPRSGQKHLASCLLHCFVGGIEMKKIDLATISQEGHGDMELGISQILMECSSVKLCALFMPRIDLWAIQSCLSVEEDVEVLTYHESSKESSSTACQIGDRKCSPETSSSELMDVTECQDKICRPSQIWRSFVEQLEYICVSSSLIILATSELPSSGLPRELRQFFGSELSTAEGSVLLNCGTPRFSVELERDFNHDKLIHSSALNLSRDLIQQFVQLVHTTNHCYSDSGITNNTHYGKKRDILSDRNVQKLVEEEPMEKQEPAESVAKLPVPSSGSKSGKGKSSLILAITSFGYQILMYPHFAELCWVTSKLNEGPSFDIRGPWKNWPFNSCIVRPCKLIAKESIANNSKGKDRFTLVRGLIAVGLAAYRGMYTSATEVSLEVRKVLELLIGLIASRIQAGKDRHQYFWLLSQVAYLEDMVNSWAHSLRSLEADAQTTNVNFKFKSAQSPEIPQPPADNPKQFGAVLTEEQPELLSTPSANPNQVEESNVRGSSFEQLELEEVMGHAAGNFHPVDLSMTIVDVESADEAVNLKAGSSQNSMSEEKGSPLEVLLRGNLASNTDLKDLIIDQSCCISEGSRQESSQSAFAEYLSQHKPEKIGLRVSSELCSQLGPEPLVENEISKSGRSASDMQLQDSRTSGSSLLTGSEVICCYSCCPVCIYALDQLAKKLLAQELKLLSPSCTVEDVHNLISALSSSLCSSIRNIYFSEGSENGGFTLSKLGSQELNGCQCKYSDNKLAVLKECVCHLEKDFSESVNVSFNHPDMNLRFIFRDGVFISANPGEESPWHCKYDTFCLCLLIELIVGMKSL